MLPLCHPSLLASHLSGPRHKKICILGPSWWSRGVTALVPLALSSSFLPGSCEALGHHPEDSDRNDQRAGMTFSRGREGEVACLTWAQNGSEGMHRIAAARTKVCSECLGCFRQQERN